MAGPIRIAVLADGSRARREFSQTARSGSRLGDVLKRAGRTAAIGLGVGLTAAAATAGKLAQAAASDEQSAALLARTLKNTTGATSAQVAATEKWITAQGKLFGVTDDELRPAISKLATATGDVQKAQRLASLAMDVSAGTGKSLESVSTALMKAQNGQVSALARLGIKTKDAAGETLSLRQVTRQMADTFGGQAATKANTLQGRVDRLKVMFTEAGEALGARLLPPLSDLAFKAADAFDEVQAFSRSNISPKLEELAGWFRENKDELKDLAITTRDTALPVIKDLAGVVGGAVKFFVGLPGPVKETAVQVGLAALAFRLLSGSIASVRGGALVSSLTGMTTAMRDTERRASALRGGVANLAGVAGMGLLYASTQTSNDGLSVLTATAGGAATGFAVGGPLGAAIGGTAGLLTSMFRAGEKAREGISQLQATMNAARGDALALADTLDQQTGASTRLTRQKLLEAAATAGVLSTAKRLDVNSRDLIGSILGQEGATRRLNAALRANGDSIPTNELLSFQTFLRRNRTGLTETAAGVRETNRALTPLGKQLKGFPREMRIRIKQFGAGVSAREIRGLERDFRPLTKREKRIIVNAVGTETSVRKVRGLYRVLESGRNVKPGTDKWADLFVGSINQAQRQGRPKVDDLIRLLSQKPRQAKADLAPFATSINSGTSRARAIANAEAPSVGRALGSGVNSGFTPYISILAGNAAAAVRAALTAARNAAVIKSPSRKMREIGDLMGQGLVDGLAARQGDTKKGGRDLVRSLLAGVGEGSQGVGKAVEKISRLVEKRIKGKDEGKREKLVLRGLKDEFKALRRNGAEQDKNNRKIDTAVQRVRSLTSAAKQYAATIRQSVVDYGNVVGLGVRDGSSVVSLTALLSQLKARAAASDRFAALIAKLRGSGVNQTTIQQLLDAGPDAGLATAEAIASGGKAAVAEVNRLTAQIASTGTRLGAAMSKAYKAAGIQAAQGLVDGLKKRQRELDQVAQRIATTLVKAVKKALGIKSPSRVFRSIGDQTLRGLELGLDETYVKRLGSTRAAALQKGFGTPALDAYAAGGGAAGTPTTVTLRLSADEANRLVRGKEIVADIDYYLGNGGTTRTIVKRAGIG